MRINLFLTVTTALVYCLRGCKSGAEKMDNSKGENKEQQWERISPVEVKNAVQLFDKD